MPSLTQLPAWRALETHARELSGSQLRDLFRDDPGRFDRFHLEAAGILLDYSKQRVTARTLELLLELAHARDLGRWIAAMFAGEAINNTEQRAALHVALRHFDAAGRPAGPIRTGGRDVMPEVAAVLARMERFSAAVRAGEWRGCTGEPIRDVVNIGIGGSDLGPRMVCEALRPPSGDGLRAHFVANVDGAQITDVLAGLRPETTLFVVTSKTFTTAETLANAHAARRWLQQAHPGPAAVARHFVAVSTNREAVTAFGIGADSMFGFWDWVGGRYSLWSAVGLSIMLALGVPQFRTLLAGAHAMDRHFREASFERNLPVLLALLGVWNTNFLGARSHVVVPYAQRLQWFVPYLQQLEMESNGKLVDREGRAVDYATAPVLWGDVGTNGQHAFFQLLHQGPYWQPVDFVLAREAGHELPGQHRMLAANCLAQAEALMRGKDADEVRAELALRGLPDEALATAVPPRCFPGNRPSSLLLLQRLDAAGLGALIALYEHKVFVQGVIWNLCSFDQWGVELGKQLANSLLAALETGTAPGHDGSTAALVARLHQRGPGAA